MKDARWGLTNQEYKLLRTLKTPRKIQDFIDNNIHYNREETGDTCRSPRVVLRTRSAHCIEGAMLAALAMRVNGREPLILDLAAKRDHDHVIAVFREHGRWGAVAMSQFNSLRYREPVFFTLRELVLSYFPFYYNFNGCKTLRSYSRPVNLKRFDKINWATREDDVWEVATHLCDVAHTKLLTPEIEKALRPANRNLMFGDRMIAPKQWRISTAPASYLLGNRAAPASQPVANQARRQRKANSSS